MVRNAGPHAPYPPRRVALETIPHRVAPARTPPIPYPSRRVRTVSVLLYVRHGWIQVQTKIDNF
jgi:hypothetical protein